MFNLDASLAISESFMIVSNGFTFGSINLPFGPEFMSKNFLALVNSVASHSI
jgi:hypothetical protein